MFVDDKSVCLCFFASRYNLVQVEQFYICSKVFHSMLISALYASLDNYHYFCFTSICLDAESVSVSIISANNFCNDFTDDSVMAWSFENLMEHIRSPFTLVPTRCFIISSYTIVSTYALNTSPQY